MANELITNFLTDVGESVNKWTTLAGKVCRIGLVGGNQICIDPFRIMLYFSSNDFILIKYLDSEKKKECALEDELPANSVKVNINNKYYIIPEAQNAIENSTYGNFHAQLACCDVMAFYTPNTNIVNQFNENA